MASFNKLIIVGYLGRDPELRYTPDGVAVCNFSIATTERRKDRNGEQQDITTWFRVTAWRRTAEICNEYLRKGSQAYVEGRLRQEEYTDRDGNPRTSLAVDVTELKFLDLGSGGHNEEAPQREERSSAPPRQQSSKASKKEPEDDDIPF
jgi:single-strand DNA-binding protein